jgi:5-methylcytosine-specific restriction endonuclease McrA
METGYQILVLNRLWQAVNVIGVERAFGLLAQDHAQVIHSEEGDFRIYDAEGWFEFSRDRPETASGRLIHTVSQKVFVPQVLLLRSYDRLPIQEMKFNRQNLFERDKFRCQYCGTKFSPKDLNMDHVTPRDRGGKTSWENIVTCCLRCNSAKGNREPHEAGMHLLRKPARPRRRPFVSGLMQRQVDDSWRHFLHA